MYNAGCILQINTIIRMTRDEENRVCIKFQ